MNSAIRPLNTLLRLVRARRGLTVRQLQDRTGRDARTIRRDILAIRRAGWRVIESVEQYGRKRFRAELPAR